MRLRPIRLGVVLTIHGAIVILAMVIITVMFSLMNEKSARKSATNLVQTTMQRNTRLVRNYITSYENVTKQAVVGLDRFDASAARRNGTLDVTAYAAAWSAMTIGVPDRQDILAVSEMWRENTAAPWFAAGCTVGKHECYFYTAEHNDTYVVPSNLLSASYDFSSTVVKRDTEPDLYQRHMAFLNTNAENIPRSGLWSPMYVEFSSSRWAVPEGSRCDGTQVSTTISFYYCLSWLSVRSGSTEPGVCMHVVAMRVNAEHFGDLDDLQLTPRSSTFVLSVFVDDKTNGHCISPPDVEEAFKGFVLNCGVSLPLTDGGTWYDRQQAVTERCRKQESLTIDHTAVVMTASVTTQTGIFIVLIDVVPYTFFFANLDRVKHVSIAISATVCAAVVAVSMLSWLAIVVPIQWICHGLHRASTLTSEPSAVVKKASRYTFIYEVNVLYKSYLELRRALAELKAFVPQGLFVAPSATEKYSDAMLLALFGSSEPGSDFGGGGGGVAQQPCGLDSDEDEEHAEEGMELGSDGDGSDSNRDSNEHARRDRSGKWDSKENAASASATSFTASTGGVGSLSATLPSPSTTSTPSFSPASGRHSQVEVSVRESEPRVHQTSGDRDGSRRHSAAGEDEYGVYPLYPSPSITAAVVSIPRRRRSSTGLGFSAGFVGAASGMGHMQPSTFGSSGIVQVFPVSQTEEILAVTGNSGVHPMASTRELLRDAGLLDADCRRERSKKKHNNRQQQQQQQQSSHCNSHGGECACVEGGSKSTGLSRPAKRKGGRGGGEAGHLLAMPIPIESAAKGYRRGSSAVGFGQDAMAGGGQLARAARHSHGASKRRHDSSGVRAGAAIDSRAGCSSHAGRSRGDSGRSATILGANESPSAASLELNLNQSRINTFRHVSCSFVVLSFSFLYANTETLEAVVTELMDIVVKVILRCGGVIEVFRPDLIAASFGAHASLNRHAQFATLCAVTLMKKIPARQRRLTRLVIDSGLFYVGNCGAHGRTARVVFGERFDFALDLMKFEIGLGRVLCTDRIAALLPSSFVVPMECIVPLRNRVHSIQLFQVLNPAKRHDPLYKEGANRFRSAYGAAVSGDLAGALAIIDEGGLFDPELAAYFATALRYLQSLKPPRPRYCRFQLPQFEMLGSEPKERVQKYLYEKLALKDIDNANGGFTGGGSGNARSANDTLPSINFGFGDQSASGHDDTLDPQNLSRAFFQRSLLDRPMSCHHTQHAAAIAFGVGVNSGSGGHAAGTVATEHASGVSGAAAAALPISHSQRANAMLDATASGGGDGAGTGGDAVDGGCGDPSSSGGYGGIGFALFGGSTSSSDLPSVIVDHKGESWYRMPNPIGSGAFAEVYKALSSSGVVMSLKCIRLSSTNVQLADVVSEVNTACKLFNDHIVNYTGWAHVGSYLVIIMDFMSGGSLHSVLSAFPRGMPVQLARRYASDILKGLAYLHRSGIVHADIKPQNILLAADGSCKLGDFGSSVSKANAFACGGDVFNLRGTPQYMSPEVAAGDTPTMASDLFSFGVALFEMLTGHRPWKQRGAAAAFTSRRPSLPTRVYQAPGEASSAMATPFAAVPMRSATEDIGGHDWSLGSAQAYSREADVANVGAASAGTATPSTVGHSGSAAPPKSLAAAHEHVSAAPAAAAAAAAVDLTYTPSGGMHADAAAVHSSAGGEDIAEPFVEVVGVSDVRFIQGLANGSIVPHFQPEDLPTREAFELLRRCLSEDPSNRPSATEAVDHVFFLL